MFLIYINDITVSLKSDVKLFADDTSIFSVIQDPLLTSETLNDDLEKIRLWAYQWKLEFNPDPKKPAQEIVFSRKSNEVVQPDLIFNSNPVQKSDSLKHLGFTLDKKLSFKNHLDGKISQVYKSIGILRKLSFSLPRSSLLTIYKSFIRPHLDYCDVIYDNSHNVTFNNKIEKIQYDASLAITGAIRGASKEKLYNELGLELLISSRWIRKLGLF